MGPFLAQKSVMNYEFRREKCTKTEISERKKTNHVLNYTFGAFYIVRMRTFGAYSKYFSAPKVCFRSKFNT